MEPTSIPTLRPRPVSVGLAATVAPPDLLPTAVSAVPVLLLPGAPVKRLRHPGDVAVFKASRSYARLNGFIQAAASSVAGRAREEAGGSPVLVACRAMLATVTQWVHDIPLEDRHNSRFGNRAFRSFHSRLAERAVTDLISPILAASSLPIAEAEADELRNELCGYLLDSFGNATRIDYGTGHELHFLLFLYVLGASGVATFEAVEQRRAMVFGVLWDYVELMRLLQGHYTMEPAGSHGVWGLDDFHHLPFIVGAAQLTGPAGTVEFPPGAVTKSAVIGSATEQYLYLAMVGWIMNNKRGPFHEHSSVLYNISGLESWERIMKGMLKMYEGEVLQKIAVVQHLLFGKHFPLDPPADSP